MNALERTSRGGTRKAAILLSMLGEAEAAAILRNLSSSDLDRVTAEVASLPRVPVELTLQVLEEYKEMMAAQEYMAVGGQDVATRLLVKAFGENGAKTVAQRLSQSDDGASVNLDALRRAEPGKVARFLAGEQAQTQALLLGHLDARQASGLLMKLEPGDRAECVKRMATMGQFSTEAAAKASRVINRRFSSASDQTKRSSSESTNLADLMNHLEPAAAREILDTIETEEPTLAIKIRDMMFTFENFLEVPEPDLRELVNSIDKKTLMVALKGASDDLRTHIYRTMSSRAVDMMKEDSEMMGPVRSKDVAKAQGEMIAFARKLEAEGKIVLRTQGDDEYVL
ncbi:MAG: flagellar motor switch protein FliG [Terracidiphilus sp.]|jgi:flagellar motor switch protein FliG